MIKLKECEDSHLGEEVDRNWNEVVTQQYLFDRLAREVGGRSPLFRGTLAHCFLQQFHMQSLKRGSDATTETLVLKLRAIFKQALLANGI